MTRQETINKAGAEVTPKVTIYQAGPPIAGKWVVAWQTAYMPAPAFWCFDTRAEAEEAAAALRK